MIKKILQVFSVLCVFLVVIYGILYILILPRSKIYNKVSDYDIYFGENGKHRHEILKVNEIFPYNLDKALSIDDYIYIDYSAWNYENKVSYLVVIYNDVDYINEKNRLKMLPQINIESIYGINGFNKELCSSFSNLKTEDGVIYALSDDQNNKISYIEIQFFSRFSSINYMKYIPQEDLPIGFNALEGNPVQERFMNDN